MAEDVANGKFLAPPAVTALKEQAAVSHPNRLRMERSISEDIREEREDLKEAAEQTLNIILDLGLDGKIRYVSPSWKEVIGTAVEDVQGQPIEDLLLESKTTFTDAIDAMKRDDSRSHMVRFSIAMGPHSALRPVESSPIEEKEATAADPPMSDVQMEGLELEGQGIMVYDRVSGGESHVSD